MAWSRWFTSGPDGCLIVPLGGWLSVCRVGGFLAPVTTVWPVGGRLGMKLGVAALRADFDEPAGGAALGGRVGRDGAATARRSASRRAWWRAARIPAGAPSLCFHRVHLDAVMPCSRSRGVPPPSVRERHARADRSDQPTKSSPDVTSSRISQRARRQTRRSACPRRPSRAGGLRHFRMTYGAVSLGTGTLEPYGAVSLAHLL
jgi:hypothetical protein